MRKEPTSPERILWRALRNWQLQDLKFRRQQPIGRYIVDFYCATIKLVIELNGESHAENSGDIVRDAWLNTQGIRVLRFWNNEVMGNIEGVLAGIAAAARTPPPGPLPQGEGEKSAPPLLVGGGREEG